MIIPAYAGGRRMCRGASQPGSPRAPGHCFPGQRGWQRRRWASTVGASGPAPWSPRRRHRSRPAESFTQRAGDPQIVWGESAGRRSAVGRPSRPNPSANPVGGAGRSTCSCRTTWAVAQPPSHRRTPHPPPGRVAPSRRRCRDRRHRPRHPDVRAGHDAPNPARGARRRPGWTRRRRVNPGPEPVAVAVDPAAFRNGRGPATEQGCRRQWHGGMPMLPFACASPGLG
jgi:hypothetical protein